MFVETIQEMFSSGEIWGIIIKVLLTAIASGLVAICGALIGRIVSKNKQSKIYKYASTLVDAAEQKFPNEGTKMGPQKLDYVMSQIVIRFPTIRDNRYLYNIVEQAVYKLNEEKQKENYIKEFEEKYGEGSYIQVDDETIFDNNSEDVNEDTTNDYKQEENNQVVEVQNNDNIATIDGVIEKQEQNKDVEKQVTTKKISGGLKSF